MKPIFYWLLMSINFTSVQAASHHPQAFLDSIHNSKEEAKQIYEHYCANCHALKPLISIGAPRIGVHVEWKQRLKQSMKVLFSHTSEGLGAMPARGGCFECSDEQLWMAMEYLIPAKTPLNDKEKSIK